ncbi:MAG: 4-hydroxy-3-methylbut-2-enyl diphosphate reductase [Bacteroidales bacterium]|nr:4-hydroxy-3-methylbut-2-enyl diphosphate reductase [Bacteroidales bacterium]
MSKNLIVEIDPHSGFCFGVVEAIRRAEEILAAEGKLYCVGEIVHNDEEVKRLEAEGMVTLNHEKIKYLKNEKVLIRAHGEPPETYEILRKNHNEILDATCPIVLRLQERIKSSYNQGETILIYGKANHPEVVALVGHLGGQALVFDKIEQIDPSSLSPEVTLYSQTTRGVAELYEMVAKIEASGVRVKLKDTICRQVSGRSEQMVRFCENHDKVIFVAGTKSSNGRMLFAQCLKKNNHSYKVSSKSDIDPDWFAKDDTVGICGATSTPLWLMEEVKDYLLSL